MTTTMETGANTTPLKAYGVDETVYCWQVLVGNHWCGGTPDPCHPGPEVKQAEPVDPEKALLAKAQDNAGDGVEVDSYHRLGWYRMACGGIARIKRTYDEIACSIIIGDVVEAGSTFTDQVWSKTTGTHETNSDWNLIRWKGIEQ